MTRALFVVSEAGCGGAGCTTPVTALADAGFDVTVATPSGAAPRLDEAAVGLSEMDAAVREIHRTDARLNNAIRLGDVSAGQFDVVVFPGGHGALWDVNQDRAARRLLRETVGGEDGVALVAGHAAGILAFARDGDGFLATGRRVTGYPNAWLAERLEDDRCLPDGRKLPYSPEDEVRAVGGEWDAALAEPTCVRTDGDLITARGPESIDRAVDALLSALGLSLPT